MQSIKRQNRTSVLPEDVKDVIVPIVFTLHPKGPNSGFYKLPIIGVGKQRDGRGL
jgi:hypothetical protein